MEHKLKILLAEDDLNLGILLVDYLDSEGFDVKLCRDGDIALNKFQSGDFDLCLLDIMLPQKDGYTLAKQIRQINNSVPILFLTAKSLKEDKIKGFAIGADDYITKPFEEEELLYRIKAIIRRSGNKNQQKKAVTFNIGKFVFDHDNQTLIIDEKTRRITEKERDILCCLCNNKNKLIKRDEILLSVWGENNYFLGRSLDVFISKIRKYLKDDADISIENIHNVGFILNCEK